MEFKYDINLKQSSKKFLNQVNFLQLASKNKRGPMEIQLNPYEFQFSSDRAQPGK
jgi:hypothetical protein